MTRAALILVLVTTVACHRPEDIMSPINEARALASSGSIHEGAQLLADEAGAMKNPENRDYLLFQQGLLYARAGMQPEAHQVWDPLYESTEYPQIKGRILYEKGMLARSVGELIEAEKWFKAVITEHPENGLALTALFRLEKLVLERAGDEAVRALLEQLLPAALETTFGDDVLWELFAWHHERGEKQVAKQYLLAIRKSYPFPTGGRGANTLFALADLAEEQEDWDEAIKYLKEVVGPVGESVLIGTSSGGSKAIALIRIGHILEQHFDDPAGALKLYWEVVKMEDLETHNDDGLLEVARVLHEMGEDDEACEQIRQLYEKYPYSNKHKKAAKLAELIGCGQVEETP